MARKRSIALAAGVSAVLVASSAAFAIANGIFREPSVDQVGTFQTVDQLLPADTPTTEVGAGAPPAPGATTTTNAGSPVAAGVPPTQAEYPAYPTSEDTAPENEPTTVPVMAPTSTTPTTVSTSSTVPEDRHEDEGDDDHEDHTGRDDDD